MKIGQICNRRVAVIDKNQRVLEAARRMRDEHVGDLVVIEQRGQRGVPIGVVTDRDIVVGLLARDVDHVAQVDVGDLLTRDVVTSREDEDVSRAIERMQRHGIRRMLVVDDAGALVGILTVDDLLGLMAKDLDAVVALVDSERRHEISQRT
jgi:CBS domain-containing protein